MHSKILHLGCHFKEKVPFDERDESDQKFSLPSSLHAVEEGIGLVSAQTVPFC
jgi:hypothetical protein